MYTRAHARKIKERQKCIILYISFPIPGGPLYFYLRGKFYAKYLLIPIIWRDTVFKK